MSEIVTQHQPFRRAAETERLVKRGLELGEDTLLSYMEVSSLIGCNPQSDKGRSITSSARRILLLQHDIVLECIPKDGFLKLRSDQIPELGAKTRSHISRSAKRGVKKLRCAKLDELSNDSKRTALAEMACLGAIAYMSRPNQVRAIECKVQAEMPDVNSTLKLFAGI